MMTKILYGVFLILALSIASCASKTQQSKNMIIYSVTTKVDHSVHADWKNWIDSHIEHVLETGKFSKAIFSKVENVDESDCITYNVQFWAYSMESLEAYRKEDAPKIKQGTLERFPKGLTNTRTEYSVIKSFENKK